MHRDGGAKFIVLHIAALSAAGAIAAAVHARRQRRRRRRRMMRDVRLIPQLVLSNSGRVEELETFSQYVARQMGFSDMNECPQLCKLACDYLRKAQGCEEEIFAFFSREADPEPLYVKFIEELDKCILGYFAFHWSHATLMVSQVLSADSESKGKLKNMVMEITRKQRFERVTRDLKVARVFSTLLEEMKAIGLTPDADNKCTDVMVPAAHSDRSPVLLLMGGGMGAGKSTVLKDILQEAFWSGAAANAVVVEADAFKETDVIYRALHSRGHHSDMLQTAELVHQSSTDAASSLLVTALNEGRDVIMDGTLSWEPFVEQTIALARAIHRRRYRMGVGYKVADDGSVTENYWEPVEEEGEKKNSIKRRPYRIELVGVVCDAYLAVVRGIRRAILMGRAVRVKSQLKSHKRFANAFPRYCKLVDNARLYCSNSMGTAPKLIAWKDGNSSLLVEPHEITCLEMVSNLNEDADSVYDLYPPAAGAGATKGSGGGGGAGVDKCSHSVWNDVVMSPARFFSQKELKAAIQINEGLTS